MGLQAMFEAHSEGNTRPLRFLYMSGTAAERDQSKTPSFMPQYSLMRVSTRYECKYLRDYDRGKLTISWQLFQGETENKVLAFAAEHKGAVEACVAKPGLITAPGQILKTMFAMGMKYLMSLPNVDVAEISAAMLHEVIHGFEKEPLENDDLVRIGRQALKDAEQ